MSQTVPTLEGIPTAIHNAPALTSQPLSWDRSGSVADEEVGFPWGGSAVTVAVLHGRRVLCFSFHGVKWNMRLPII